MRIEPEFDGAQIGSRQGSGLNRGDEGIRGDPGRMGPTGNSGVPGRDQNAYLLSYILQFIYFRSSEKEPLEFLEIRGPQDLLLTLLVTGIR